MSAVLCDDFLVAAPLSLLSFMVLSFFVLTVIFVVFVIIIGVFVVIGTSAPLHCISLYMLLYFLSVYAGKFRQI